LSRTEPAGSFPQHERKGQLNAIIHGTEHLLYCDHIEQHGKQLFEFACENDLEGVMAKPRNSPYQFTDTQTYWLKIKNREYSQRFGRDDLFARAEKKPNRLIHKAAKHNTRLCPSDLFSKHVVLGVLRTRPSVSS
jgi:hypothetical protein